MRTIVPPLLKPVRPTQAFGVPNPELYGSGGVHSGWDFAARFRQPVFAPEDGIIIQRYANVDGWGYGIRYAAADFSQWILAHFSQPVELAGYVRAGEVVGYADSTGKSTGHHLHWENRSEGGKPRDAMRLYARSVALAAGVDPDVFEKQIEVESRYNPFVVSRTGAQGIAQIQVRDPQDSTVIWHPNVDPWDPFDALRYGAGLMTGHLAAFGGEYDLALAAYNGGPGVAAMPRNLWPAETKWYVETILKGLDVASTKEIDALRADSKLNHERKMAALVQWGDTLGLTVRMRGLLTRAGLELTPDDRQLYTRLHQDWADGMRKEV